MRVIFFLLLPLIYQKTICQLLSSGECNRLFSFSLNSRALEHSHSRDNMDTYNHRVSLEFPEPRFPISKNTKKKIIKRMVSIYLKQKDLDIGKNPPKKPRGT